MYKKHSLILLPTDKVNGSFYKHPHGQLYKSRNAGNQHLYIIDDSEIKEGDWIIGQVLFKGNGSPEKYLSTIPLKVTMIRKNNKAVYCSGEWYSNYNKIIATTDKNITFDFPNGSKAPYPFLSKSFIDAFIREYNKGNIITDILVEVEGIIKSSTWEKEEPEEWRLKVSSSNEITIKRIEPKLYTQEQVDRYLTVLNERLELSSSIQSESAYLIMKENFLKIFKL